MAVVTDGYWDEEWVEYTYELSGRKDGGAEGFLIMFRCRGAMEPRGLALNAHPPRMTGQQNLQYWWNLGGMGKHALADRSVGRRNRRRALEPHHRGRRLVRGAHREPGGPATGCF